MKRPANSEPQSGFGKMPRSVVAVEQGASMENEVVTVEKPATKLLAYRRVNVIRSSKYSAERLTNVGTFSLGEDQSTGAQDACIYICPSSLGCHPFMGFGGSFTESSAVVFDKMSSEKQEEILHAYFNPSTGLGYELGRISIASCDFSLGNWTCGDLVDGDMSLAGFSIERYNASILPLCKKAQDVKGGDFTMLASPWSPPPWMKTKRKFNGDGHLLPDCAAAWALHFAKFVKAMAGAGINIWGVSVQNEPEAAQTWESCIYTATEERDFVRDHLGPILAKEGLSSVKILVWDHNRDGMLERAAVAYADPEAAKYIWGLGYHWYGDARFETWPARHEVPFEDRQGNCEDIFELRARAGFENVRKVHELCPEKHILFTEGCQELSGRPLQEVLGRWKYGERYGMNIIADLNSGTEGWIDWNLYLDQHGGPNHVGNYCVAPIICDTRYDAVHYQAAYWYLGHFSKFIRPGARRVTSSTSRDVLEVVAFLNLDGSLIAVVMNQSGAEVEFWLKVPGAALKAEAPRRSITTFVLDDGDISGCPPAMSPIRRVQGPIKTQHGTYLKVTDGSPDQGPLIQTAGSHSGWETFVLIQDVTQPYCMFLTFHDTWLSVTNQGEVTVSETPGEHERFFVEPHCPGKVRLKAHNGSYISVGSGNGKKVVAVSAPAGDSELFELRT